MQSTMNAWESGNRSVGWPALAVAIAVHLLAFYFLNDLTRHTVRDRPIAQAIMLRLLPAPTPTVPDHPPKAVPQPPEKTRRGIPRAEHAVPMPSPPLPRENATAPAARHESDLPPAPTSVTEDSIARFKRDAGNIDRDMRSKAPKLLEAPVNTVQARLEKGLRNAARPASSVMAEKVCPMGDASRNSPRPAAAPTVLPGKAPGQRMALTRSPRAG